MAPRKGKSQKPEEQVSLGPQVVEGENVFGVAHIFASFNDTFVHVTDLSGKWVPVDVIRTACTNTDLAVPISLHAYQSAFLRGRR